jgi:RecA-family ATPase
MSLSDAISAELNSGLMPDLERGRIVIRDAAYYLSERPPIEYVVEKLIAESSVNVWFGQWGAKKTWAAIDLAVCVASGKQWLGMATEPCNVLIIDEESGDTRLANRIKDTMRGELGQLANASVPIKSVSLAQFNLLKKPDDAHLLAGLVLELDAKLVIIDALADVMLGGDENAVKDTQPVFANLRFIAELTGAAFIVIHHANKGGGYRGSSAIAGAIDTLLSVESKQDNSLITFKTEKMRDGEPLNFACEANWTDEGFYLTQSEITERAFLSKSQQYVLDFFTEKGDAKFADLLNFTGDLYAENTLRKAVQYLINEKLLERKDDGGQRVEAIYGIKRC